ncbi:MAG: DUF4388 domain-containing protein [bacterium]
MISDDWLQRNALNQGVITGDGLQLALERQQRQGGDLFDNLVEVRAADETALLSLVARALNTRYVSLQQLARLNVPEQTLKLVPKELAVEHAFLPVNFNADTGVLVAVAPDSTADYIMLPLLDKHGVREITTYVGSKRSVNAAIRKLYLGDFYAFDRVDTSSQDEYRQLMDVYSHNYLDEEQLKGIEPEEYHGNQMPIFTGQELEQLSQRERSSSSTYDVIDPWGSHADWMKRYTETLKVLVNRIEMDAGWRQGHSAELARLAGLVGKRISQSERDITATEVAALLHESGKPHKPHLTLSIIERRQDVRAVAGRLVDAPQRAMEAALLPQPVSEILLSLYERYDGLGFPRRLTGRGVPLGARILAVVDEYLGLLFDPEHPCGTTLNRDAAVEELFRHQSTLFDPTVIEILKQTVTGESLRQEFLGKRATLLVVDPDVEEATGLELKLVAAGFGVVTARNAAQAARRLLRETVDLVICEVELEPVDGFVLCEKLKKDSRTANTPVLFVSCRSDSDSVNRGFALGAKDYIVKPYAFELLRAKVQRALEQAPVVNRPAARGVSGSLAEMSLPDIVQILSAGRRSGALKVSSALTEGTIYFMDGRIVDAESTHGWGEEAVYDLLRVEEGDFVLDSDVRATQTTIQMTTERLILEGMRRMDESRIS